MITGREKESEQLPGDLMFMVSGWILIFGYRSEGGQSPISQCFILPRVRRTVAIEGMSKKRSYLLD